MSGEAGGAESVRELIERATRQNRRSHRLSIAVYAGLLGVFIFGLAGSASYSVSHVASWGFWIVGIGCLATSIFVAALNTKQHKRCAASSGAVIERSQIQCGSQPIEPLHEGEFVGAYEVLCCDESMVMMSHRRSYFANVAIRSALLLISISITTTIVAMIAYGGTGILNYLKPVLIYGAVGAVALFLALRRSPLRWYASREEMILRIESIRWVFVREIEDLMPDQIESLHLDGDVMVAQTPERITSLQQIGIPQLIGLKLGKEETKAAEALICVLQYSRIRGSLEQVFGRLPDWTLYHK